MRKLITAGLAALTLTSALAPAVTASAQDRRDHRGDRHDSSGAALAAGPDPAWPVGAAIANGGRGDYRDGYYYGPPAIRLPALLWPAVLQLWLPSPLPDHRGLGPVRRRLCRTHALLVA